MAELKHHRAYALYAQNIPLTQIAIALGVSRQTISSWKKRYKWEAEILIDATSSKELKAKEQQFVSSLIRQWESATDELEASDLPKKLEILERYTKLYFKLKAGDGDVKFAKEKLTKEVAYETIEEIAKISIRHNAMPVAEFLSEHADEVVHLVRSR